MQFDAVLRSFIDFFDREGIRYAVIGGMAMQAWGHSRFTKDVDFVVSRAAQARVVAFAEMSGYETLNVSPGYSNHLHPNDELGRVDFMYVDEKTGGQIFDASVSRPVIGDVQAPVASPEHLAMMKATAMKNAPARALFEGEDVRLLLSLPDVDQAAVRDYFAKIGMLGLFDVIQKAR